MSLISPETTSGIGVADSAGNLRVRLGRIGEPTAANPTGDYGLKVTSSDAQTTIIDGTSNMFKIAASGTLQVAMPVSAPSGANVNVNLPALGDGFTVPPAILTNITMDETNIAEQRKVGISAIVEGTGHVEFHSDAGIRVLGDGTVTVGLVIWTNTRAPSSGGVACRYYVLVEAGI
jgi:hypothetical protein